MLGVPWALWINTKRADWLHADDAQSPRLLPKQGRKLQRTRARASTERPRQTTMPALALQPISLHGPSTPQTSSPSHSCQDKSPLAMRTSIETQLHPARRDPFCL